MGRVLVTGSTGFLGRELAFYLRGLGYDVVVTGRDTAKLAALKREGFEGFSHDFRTPLPQGAFSGAVDFVVHCAGLSAPFGRASDFYRANVTTTEHVIELFKEKNASRLIFISSPTVYFGFCDALNLPETAPLPRPVNAYAATKRTAEQRVLACRGAIILRPRGIYGKGEETLIPRLVVAAKRGPLPVFRNGQARIDLTHVSDVCRAIASALVAPQEAGGEVFNISGGDVLPIRDIVDRVCTRLGQKPRWRPMPFWPLKAFASVNCGIRNALPHQPEPSVTPYTLGLFAFAQSLNLAKAQKMLGWAPNMGFDQGLAQTLPTREGRDL